MLSQQANLVVRNWGHTAGSGRPWTRFFLLSLKSLRASSRTVVQAPDVRLSSLFSHGVRPHPIDSGQLCESYLPVKRRDQRPIDGGRLED